MSKDNQHSKYKKIEEVFNDLLRFFYLTSDVAIGDRGIYLTVNYPDTLVFPYQEINQMLKEHEGKEVAGYKWIIDYDVLLDENGMPVMVNGEPVEDTDKPTDIWLYIGADDYTPVLKLFIDFFTNKINKEDKIKIIDRSAPIDFYHNIVSYTYLDKSIVLKHLTNIQNEFIKLTND
ncbi:MAG: hypothetical protein ACP5GJ_03435 [Nanopusillaceae archaeon]|jgi:hypothetical protein